MNPFVKFCLYGALMFLAGCQERAGNTENSVIKPNILLIVFEDMSPRIGAYGDDVAHTPVLDSLAEQGVVFTNVFTTAGVCAPSRAALITGVHQHRLNAQHMRTKGPLPGLKGGGPIEYEAVPPAHIKAFPEVLRAHGYYTVNKAKTDYQFGEPFTIWDESGAQADWKNTPEGMPFFAMITLMQTHESYLWPEDLSSANPLVKRVIERNKRELAGKEQHVSPDDVIVPPYLPDTYAVRQDLARQYNNIAFTEKRITTIIEQLKASGKYDDTIILVTTDHGDGLPRMKRTVFDSGLHVPLIAIFPNGKGAGTTNNSLVSFVDLAPGIYSLAGITPPGGMDGSNIFAEDFNRQYIFASADRHDTVTGNYKAVRDKRYKYIRNYQTDKPFFELLAFRSVMPSMQALWKGYKSDTLSELQASYFEAQQPYEMLFDLQNDPHEVANLAQNPSYSNVKKRLSGALDDWLSSLDFDPQQSEAQIIESIWPGMQQPETEKPTFTRLSDGSIALSSATPGSSIGFSYKGESRWRLYTGPVKADARQIQAKAIRYGYKESAISSFSVE